MYMLIFIFSLIQKSTAQTQDITPQAPLGPLGLKGIPFVGCVNTTKIHYYGLSELVDSTFVVACGSKAFTDRPGVNITSLQY